MPQQYFSDREAGPRPRTSEEIPLHRSDNYQVYLVYNQTREVGLPYEIDGSRMPCQTYV